MPRRGAASIQGSSKKRWAVVAKRGASAHQQRLGSVHGSVQVPGHLGHRQPVEVAQRERGPVVRAELAEHLAGPDPLDPGFWSAGCVRLERLVDEFEALV